MGKKLYISDTHFGHENVIGFDKRPFADVEEMDRCMIEYWNMRVRDEDNVFLLGDFSFRAEKPPEYYLNQLNGKLTLILGNHDQVILNSPKARSRFETIEKMLHVSDNGRQICLCHYPLAEWHSYYRGSYLIYGHIHNRLSETCLIMRNRRNAYNAAACINNYMPSTLDEIIANNQRFAEEKPLSWKDFPPTDLR